MPKESEWLSKALLAIRDKWQEERIATVSQALVALREGHTVYEEECERTSQLERAHKELRVAQFQLIQASKLASLGTLAAGVAHEINQPLTVIMSLIEQLQSMPLDRVGNHEKEFEMIARATERVSTIVNNIRVFGRQQETHLADVDPTEPIERAIELFESRIKELGVRVEREYSIKPGFQALLDSNRLQQVFVNLLSNALDALSERGPVADPPKLRLVTMRRNSQLLYVVADNGPGIQDSSDRIFDPFYTTKEAGKGTGLGLSVSHSIVEEHGGRLSFDRMAPWTLFKIELDLRA